MMIHVTHHEASEWTRLAQDAYNHDRNDFGHKFSMAAAATFPSVDGTLKTISQTMFDELQAIYRQWLIGGWMEVEGGRRVTR